MTHEEQVTVIMTTYGNPDFTRSATWALRRYWPKMRVIYADGHPTEPFGVASGFPWRHERPPDTDLVWLPGMSTEECRNAAATLVDTPYLIDMNNDTKVLTPEALDLCMEVMDTYPRCAVTGYYGIIVTDWEKRKGLVGTEFDGHTQLSAINGIFALHSVDAWRLVGGMPTKEAFYPGVPPEVMTGKCGNTGELTLCTNYRESGWNVISPRKALPIIHWGYAVEWMPNAKGTQPFDKWWGENTHHTRCNPLKGEMAWRL